MYIYRERRRDCTGAVCIRRLATSTRCCRRRTRREDRDRFLRQGNWTCKTRPSATCRVPEALLRPAQVPAGADPPRRAGRSSSPSVRPGYVNPEHIRCVVSMSRLHALASTSDLDQVPPPLLGTGILLAFSCLPRDRTNNPYALGFLPRMITAPLPDHHRNKKSPIPDHWQNRSPTMPITK